MSVNNNPGQPGFIGIQATPSRGNPGGMKARLTPDPFPVARMEHLPEEASKAYKVFSKFRGTKSEIDLKKEAYKEFDAKPLDEIWAGFKTYLETIDKGAHKIRIDLGNLTIRYLDSQERVQYIDISKPDPTKPIDVKLIDLIQKVRIAAKRVWVDLKFAHNFNETANQRINGEKPFVIPTDRWKDANPKTPTQFVDGGHLEQLVRIAGTAPGASKEALSSIISVEAFIQKLEELAKTRAKALEEQIKDPNFHQRPTADQQQVKKSVIQLQELEKDLKELDRFAIYCAVGVWGNTDPQTITQEQRFTKAKQTTELVESALSKSLKPGEDPRGETGALAWIKKTTGYGKKDAETFLGLRPFVAAYAGDAGDLLLTDKLELIRRVEEGNRELGGPSLIDFIASHVMHSNDPTFNAEQALSSLKRGFDADTTAAILKDVAQAKNEAQNIKNIVAGTSTSTDPKEAIEELRLNPALEPILGKAPGWSLSSLIK
jgi:hypothetical protein